MKTGGFMMGAAVLALAGCVTDGSDASVHCVNVVIVV